VDTINARYGRGSVGLGLSLTGTGQGWRMERESLSPTITTEWADLTLVVMGMLVLFFQ
jgi:hypothetical protein